MEQRVKETLEKQLQLLSERSEGCLPDELAELTHAMLDIAAALRMATIRTCDLVQELRTREGVHVDTVEPYRDMNIKVNGPAIVLTVVD